jgi:hypothetical protein
MEFIDDIQPGDRPGLFYLHSLLPHRIWRYLPDGRQYLLEEVWAALDPPHSRPTIEGSQVFGHKWQEDEFAVYSALQRHILQVQYVDTLIGKTLDRLESQGMLSNSLIVVMGDHGASFVPGQARRMITSETLSDISGVPLFIKLPGQVEGNRSTLMATLADILPTIADSLGSTVDWDWSGESLLNETLPTREEITVKTSLGSKFSYPASLHLEHLGQRAEAFESILGSAADARYFATRPGADLISARAGARMSDGGRVALDVPALYQDIDLESQFLPLHLTGTLNIPDSLDEPVLLAIALNDNIVSVSQSYDVDGFRNRFAALLPSNSLIQGANDLQIYLIEQNSSGPQLELLARETTVNYSLNAGRHIVGPDDQEWTFENQAGKGMVLSQKEESSSLIRLNGSLGVELDPEATVVVFSNDRYVGSTVAVNSFFTLPLVTRGMSDNQNTKVSVFALESDRAFELDYPEPCSGSWHFSPPPAWSNVSCNVMATNPLKDRDGVLAAHLDFRTTAILPYMGRGWDFKEGNISWATGQQADLVFPLPVNLNGLKFTASVQPFLFPPQLSQQQVYLLANGRKVAEWTMNEATINTIDWEVSPEILTLAKGELSLSFLMPDAESPKTLGANEDLRILGLAFLNLDMKSEKTHINDEQ